MFGQNALHRLLWDGVLLRIAEIVISSQKAGHQSRVDECFRFSS